MAVNAAEEDLYKTLLRKWKLSKYIAVFEENDWDEVGIWIHLTDEILTNDLGLNVGAIHKFNFNYKKWNAENGNGNQIENENAIDQRNDDSKANENPAQGPQYHDLRLTGNWIDNRPKYGAPARWTKDKNGLVRLHGIVELKNGQSDELVAILPEEAHPRSFIHVNRVDSQGVTVNIVIYCHGSSYGRSGDIKLRGAPNSSGQYVGTGVAFVSLNGISWYSSP